MIKPILRLIHPKVFCKNGKSKCFSLRIREPLTSTAQKDSCKYLTGEGPFELRVPFSTDFDFKIYGSLAKHA